MGSTWGINTWGDDTWGPDETSNWTTQYNPISSHEYAANAPLSVRCVNDLSGALNNAIASVWNAKLRSEIFMPALDSESGQTSERVRLVFAPVRIPNVYKTINWFMSCKRTSGTGNTKWTLYCMTAQYRGTVTFYSSYIQGTHNSSSIYVGSDTNQIRIGSDLTIYRDRNSLTWLMLTTDNDASTLSKIYTLDIIPKIS